MATRAQFPDEQSEEGEFQRQEDRFREKISAEGEYPPEEDRYHLYVSLACPWASRTVITRALKGLEETIGLTVVDPIRDDLGWAFRDGPGYSCDPINGFQYLSEAYRATDPDFDGRVTVPVLWDRKTKRIVNNNEDEICRMFDKEFSQWARKNADLFPSDLEEEHAELAQFIYHHVNNGVYKAGFATSQKAYENACLELFKALDELNHRLSSRQFLFGNRPVDADWRLFCTLIRFDPVYHGHFKCNLRRIIDYPHLQRYLLELLEQPGIAATVNLDHIKRHYYVTHVEINPTGVVPIGPDPKETFRGIL